MAGDGLPGGEAQGDGVANGAAVRGGGIEAAEGVDGDGAWRRLLPQEIVAGGQVGEAGGAAEAARAGYRFPVLFDPTQKVAQAYQAACTPDFYLFDAARKLVYRGQFDDARPGNDAPVTGRDYRAAIDAVLAGRPVAATQKPSVGCNIKWRPGNEPSYYGSTKV